MKKKLLSILLTGVMAMSLMACSGGDTSADGADKTGADSTASQENTDSEQSTDTEAESDNADEAGAAAEGSYKIGAIQLAEHPALDSSYDGFVAALKDKGLIEGENLTIDYQNAQGDISNCDTIATKLVNDQNDLILAIATAAAQAAAGKTSDIPVILTAVTDPASSGLVEDNAAPGGNVTGTSDLTPVKEQIELLKQILPEAKTVGIMYNSSEDNSIFQADIAKAECEAAGLEYQEVTVSELSQIQQVTESLIGKVDVIYIPTDNMLAEGMATVTQVANANKLPCIVGEEGMVINGGLATYGINYYNLGYMAGEQAAAILLDGEDIAQMPIGYLSADDCTLSVNTTTAEELGIEIPSDILDKSAKVE